MSNDVTNSFKNLLNNPDQGKSTNRSGTFAKQITTLAGVTEGQINSLQGLELFSYLPAYYENSRVMHVNMDVKGSELDSLYLALDETLAQFFVRTATWALESWEMELGIPVDLEKPLEQRRSVVESKLRGSGKFSGDLIRKIMNSFGVEGEVDFHPTEYKFGLSFENRIPENMIDFKKIIEDIKPAHLVFYMNNKTRLAFLHETDMVSRIRLRSRVRFFGGKPWYLDGVELLNGIASLSGWTEEPMRYLNRKKLVIQHRMDHHQEGNVKIRNHYWKLDGSMMLDGSQMLSSTEKVISI
ncbi:putative phage tail protein [Paenibacillus polymyxa]|uniref:putative phage tail protein n=1 Tax=Paenibacillus polymyxa TaxID=1406 RepID=UPI0004DEED06|nr:putative phage tail protein [Paenibacillus polymyxa]MBY7736866.1 YmfQ family protein [Paenibacillus polymyxa]